MGSMILQQDYSAVTCIVIRLSALKPAEKVATLGADQAQIVCGLNRVMLVILVRLLAPIV